MKGKTARIFLLSVIVLAAVFFRLKGLTFQSLWLDELINLYNSSPAVSLGHAIRFCREAEHTPPLFYILIWVWQRIWGPGEFSARLLPALFGVLGVGGIYYLGRELFSAKTGLVAAAITALLSFHIRYSQEARPYSLLFVTVVLSYLFLVRLLSRPGWKNVLLYWLFTVLLLYSHYYGLFVFAAQLFLIAVVLGSAGPKRNALLKKLLPALLLVGLAYLPWLPTLFRMVRIDAFWIKTPAPGFFIGFFRQYAGAEPYLSAVFGLLLIGYLLSGKGRGEFSESRLLLASWIFIALFIPYFRSFNNPPILIVRYSTAVLPAVILMAARGLTLLPDARFRYFLLGTVILLLLVNLFYTRGGYYSTVRKAQWRQAAEFIILNDPQGEYPVCGHPASAYYFDLIFGRPREVVGVIKNLPEARKWYRRMGEEKIPAFWLLEVKAIPFNPKVWDFFDRKLKKVRSVELRGAKAALYAADRR